jgi:hypothetical protein
MTMTTENTQAELEEWLATRKEAALKINPETAEVDWEFAEVGNPYGVHPPEECRCIGREYFARSPGSDIWVWFGDLPEATEKVLWDKHKRKLAFPAGGPCDPLWPSILDALLPNTDPRVE